MKSTCRRQEMYSRKMHPRKQWTANESHCFYLAPGEALYAAYLHVEENKTRQVEHKEEDDSAEQRLRLIRLLVPAPTGLKRRVKQKRTIGLKTHKNN